MLCCRASDLQTTPKQWHYSSSNIQTTRASLGPTKDTKKSPVKKLTNKSAPVICLMWPFIAYIQYNNRKRNRKYGDVCVGESLLLLVDRNPSFVDGATNSHHIGKTTFVLSRWEWKSSGLVRTLCAIHFYFALYVA